MPNLPAKPKLPTKIYTVVQIKALERIAIQECGITGLELMKRAGSAVFLRLRENWPDAMRIAVFCGAGNNAGDGYIVATLALQADLSVTVYSAVSCEKLNGDALLAYQAYCALQGHVEPFQPEQPIAADVIVDALLGTGLNKPVIGIMAQAIENINNSQIPVIAVDVPSGLNADTGAVMGYAVAADCTVTFIGLKQGLFTGQAADYCGDIFHDGLAVPNAVFEQVPSVTYRVTGAQLPPRSKCSHKGHYGHVLVIGGDQGYSGAARLAGEAALRVGAGLVSIATRPEHASLMNVGRPELMCHGIDTANQLAKLLDKASVIVVGPGLGRSAWAKELFIALVNATNVLDARKPLIVDADALYLLANARIKHADWILTPHPGEAARLLHISTPEIEQDRFSAVTAIQARYDGIAVLKGSGTLIASSHDIAVSNTGNPGMASGGMGDVLSGIIGGLVAQGLTLKEAAQQGVYLHGLAADKAREHYGERGLLASDLMFFISQVVA
ncbi:NAD(P)H-hydrate dehydratase [Crenothrix sp.]|uniref:NAD(P)H-hydrate dehydratase n=1 Tax=Crenothrix sp. TaxID=3100433 RepID=UPI00374CE83F